MPYITFDESMKYSILNEAAPAAYRRIKFLLTYNV